jgi:membrane-bound metal-dependent hydrolase YbcI (DUF457 family)
MWPWGHLAVGYLVYTALTRMRENRPPSGPEALLVAFGTQFPDFIDKPLAWVFDVLPGGRTLMHSLFAVAIVTAFVAVYARRHDRFDLAAAFSVGYLTHPFADALLAFLQGQFQYAGYFLWPLFGMPEYETAETVLASIGWFHLTVYGVFQFLLAALAVWLWTRHGRPGLATLGRLVDTDHRRPDVRR